MDSVGGFDVCFCYVAIYIGICYCFKHFPFVAYVVKLVACRFELEILFVQIDTLGCFFGLHVLMFVCVILVTCLFGVGMGVVVFI